MLTRNARWFGPMAMLAAGAAAHAQPEAGPRRVLVADFTARGVEPQLAQQAGLLASQALHGAPGLTVVAMDDVRAVMGVEKTQALMGCAEQGSCAADLARGVGVDLLVTGSVGRVGTRMVASLVLMDVASARVLQRVQVDAADAGGLARKLTDAMPQLLGLGKWAAGQQVSPDQVKSLAVLDLVASGVPADVAQNLTGVLGAELRRVPGASVISRDDIQAMLSLEEDKLRMGCDDASCLAEIGGALGVEQLVAGTVGRLSDSYLITLRLISVKSTRVENRITETYSGPADQLIRATRHAARRLVGLQATQPGKLAVGTAQPGTAVLVDGAPRGKTPLEVLVGLGAGPHTLTLRKSGFEPWQADVYVDPDDTTVMWVSLKEKPLGWYQRWQTWAAVGTAAGVLVTTVAAVAAAATVAGVYVWRVTQAGDPNGGGSVTVE